MGIPTLISTSTITSATSSVDITSGIDSTYDEYMFVLTDVAPATDSQDFSFQVNGAGESGFNETITSTVFRAYHPEGGSGADLAYDTSRDQAQGTAYQPLSGEVGGGADESLSGILHLYSPASTTYVKHFIWRGTVYFSEDAAYSNFNAGYINTTTAIDEISFKFASGNIANSVIQMYGIA